MSTRAGLDIDDWSSSLPEFEESEGVFLRPKYPYDDPDEMEDYFPPDCQPKQEPAVSTNMSTREGLDIDNSEMNYYAKMSRSEERFLKRKKAAERKEARRAKKPFTKMNQVKKDRLRDQANDVKAEEKHHTLFEIRSGLNCVEEERYALQKERAARDAVIIQFRTVMKELAVLQKERAARDAVAVKIQVAIQSHLTRLELDGRYAVVKILTFIATLVFWLLC